MGDRNFRQLLEAQWSRGNFVCVGLDSDFDEVLKRLNKGDYIETIYTFNRDIIKATRDLVCAFKLNTAFYEKYGSAGWSVLLETIRNIRRLAPNVAVILDAKRADIGNTNKGYVYMAFDYLKADAITVHPYLGREALQPFLDHADKGIIVLCRTSNPGADEFQDLEVIQQFENKRLYAYVAEKVARTWNKNNNCALVVGATYPEELREVRGIVGDMPILIPGIGAQGGDVEKTVTAGKDSRAQGMIINSSRGIIFASKGADFAEAARCETIKLRDMINQYRLVSPKPKA